MAAFPNPPAGVTILGPSVVEQPIRIDEDRQYGVSFVRTIEGWAPDVLTTLIATRPNSESRSYSQEGGIGRLQTRFASPVSFDGSVEMATNEVTLRTNIAAVDIFKHPIFAILSPALVAAIRDVINGNNPYPDYAARKTFLEGINTAQATLAIAAYHLLLYGEDSWLTAQSYTLVRTRTASRFFPDFQIAFAGDGKLFTSDALVDYTGLGALPVPYAIPALPATPLETETLLTADAWLKIGTDVSIIANGNNQVQETWQSGRWPTIAGFYVPA